MRDNVFYDVPIAILKVLSGNYLKIFHFSFFCKKKINLVIIINTRILQYFCFKAEQNMIETVETKVIIFFLVP